MRRLTRLCKILYAVCNAFLIPCTCISLIRTGTLALVALTKAIPPPIKPPPNTPTLAIGLAKTPATPDSFFISVVAKNTLRKLFDSGVMTNSPKRCASSAKPFSNP